MGFWDSFGSSDYQEVKDTSYGSLAAQVVQHYGIGCSTSSVGGSLIGLDIKHMDALQLIKVSLLQDSLDQNGPYEMYSVDSATSPTVEFREVGATGDGISDLYFRTQSATFKDSCAGVLITGRKELTKRNVRSWTSVLIGSEIYDVTEMLTNCNKDNFSTHAIVVYRDPHLNSSYTDNIDSLYNITTPYESILGYARHFDTSTDDPYVTITHSQSSTVPILVGDSLGILFPRPIVNAPPGEAACFTDKDQASGGGIEIPISSSLRYDYGEYSQDNFIKVSKIFVSGKKMFECQGRPADEEAMLAYKNGNENVNCDIWASMDDTESKLIALEEGVHYIINYDGGIPKVLFASSAKQQDGAEYGDNVTYNLYGACGYAQKNNGGDPIRGLTGNILPLGGAGILVEQVWALVDLDTPSISVVDPNGNAYDVASSISYDLAAITIIDEPPPIAFNGNIVNQSDGIKDNDPTTEQGSFTNTAMEQVLTSMDAGGGVNLSMSFMSASECAGLSKTLYNYINSDSGAQTVYTCGPNCNPELGVGTTNGVINAISYQYTDSNSYIVSVTVGSKLIMDNNLVGISGGPYLKKVETISCRGTVISDLGNHVNCKVRIDGVGEQTAINCQPEVLRVGDKVTCTIHNNPVEQ